MCTAVAMRCCGTSWRRCQSQGTGLGCIIANSGCCCSGGGAFCCDKQGCDRAWRHDLTISFSIGSNLTHPYVAAAAEENGHNGSTGSIFRSTFAEAVFIVL